MTSQPAVSLRRVARSFGSVRALDEIDLDIESGELIALLGPSGCGKTTALRALAGLEDIDSGEILLGGRNIADVPARRRDMAMVFQAYSLFPHLSARANVEFPLRLRHVQMRERERIAREKLELVGLDEHAERFPHELSGGQQQRVALARALAISPRVLLLDEPLSALDAKVRVQLRDEIRRIQQEIGITTLFVTHDQEEALAVADRVGVMRHGRIEQLASPTSIYQQPASAFVADFIGVANRIAGVADGAEATVFASRVPLLPGSAASGEVDVLVRPEHLRIAPEGSGVEGTVVSVSFLGAHSRVRVQLGGGGLVTVQTSAKAADVLRAGDSVRMSVEPAPAFAVARQGAAGDRPDADVSQGVPREADVKAPASS